MYISITVCSFRYCENQEKSNLVETFKLNLLELKFLKVVKLCVCVREENLYHNLKENAEDCVSHILLSLKVFASLAIQKQTAFTVVINVNPADYSQSDMQRLSAEPSLHDNRKVGKIYVLTL